MRPRDIGAVAHQQADGGRGSEDAGDPEVGHQLPGVIDPRVVDRPLVGDRRATGDERGVDDVAVADHPTDVGCRPPDVVGPETEDPATHRGDVDLVSAVGVDRQLRPGGRAGGGEDEGRLVGLHLGMLGRMADARRQELGPGQVTWPVQEGRRFVAGLAEILVADKDHDVLDGPWVGGQCVVDDRLERHVPALTVGDVRGQDEARAAGPDAVAEGCLAEPGEDDRMDRPDPRAGEHGHHGLGTGRQVEGDPITAVDTQSPEPGGGAPDLVEQLGVGE